MTESFDWTSITASVRRCTLQQTSCDMFRLAIRSNQVVPRELRLQPMSPSIHVASAMSAFLCAVSNSAACASSQLLQVRNVPLVNFEAYKMTDRKHEIDQSTFAAMNRETEPTLLM